MRELGLTTRWKGRVTSLGWMVEPTQVNTRTIKKRGSECFLGQTEGNTMANGFRESNTGEESIQQAKPR